MSLIGMTVLLLVFLMIGVPAAVYAFRYKPKEITYLTPESYDEKMREIENLRFGAITDASNIMALDKLNAFYDNEKEKYAIRR